MKTGALSRKEQQLPGQKRSRAGGGSPLHSPLLNSDESLEGLVSGDWRGMSRKYLHLGERVWVEVPPERVRVRVRVRERHRERERARGKGTSVTFWGTLVTMKGHFCNCRALW